MCFYHIRRLHRQIRRRIGQEVTSRLVLTMIIIKARLLQLSAGGLTELHTETTAENTELRSPAYFQPWTSRPRQASITSTPLATGPG